MAKKRDRKWPAIALPEPTVIGSAKPNPDPRPIGHPASGALVTPTGARKGDTGPAPARFRRGKNGYQGSRVYSGEGIQEISRG